MKPFHDSAYEESIQPMITLVDRTRECRRKKIRIKYLHLGKCIDRRKQKRRKNDRIDLVALEKEKYISLGPGWI